MGRKTNIIKIEIIREKVSFFNLVPRDVASRAAKERSDAGFELKQEKQFI
jgi:hypothetical protein